MPRRVQNFQNELIWRGDHIQWVELYYYCYASANLCAPHKTNSSIEFIVTACTCCVYPIVYVVDPNEWINQSMIIQPYTCTTDARGLTTMMCNNMQPLHTQHQPPNTWTPCYQLYPNILHIESGRNMTSTCFSWNICKFVFAITVSTAHYDKGFVNVRLLVERFDVCRENFAFFIYHCDWSVLRQISWGGVTLNFLPTKQPVSDPLISTTYLFKSLVARRTVTSFPLSLGSFTMSVPQRSQ